MFEAITGCRRDRLAYESVEVDEITGEERWGTLVENEDEMFSVISDLWNLKIHRATPPPAKEALERKAKQMRDGQQYSAGPTPLKQTWTPDELIREFNAIPVPTDNGNPTGHQHVPSTAPADGTNYEQFMQQVYRQTVALLDSEAAIDPIPQSTQSFAPTVKHDDLAIDPGMFDEIGAQSLNEASKPQAITPVQDHEAIDLPLFKIGAQSHHEVPQQQSMASQGDAISAMFEIVEQSQLAFTIVGREQTVSSPAAPTLMELNPKKIRKDLSKTKGCPPIEPLQAGPTEAVGVDFRKSLSLEELEENDEDIIFYLKEIDALKYTPRLERLDEEYRARNAKRLLADYSKQMNDLQA
ncbi:hypothetical protein B0H66DRAFT_535824 [Apodospora peruviana]|uniref:Uncharacterized protein n=1 Tax=Apodospora peruviana TaxID=516989 RepID=A0AAE0M0U0_9PEZI|nr:hypothetical protein B0H66DRAFT_535824 [Apodospora peruviana]